MSGLPGFDAWLTTDRVGEAQEAAMERLAGLWEEFCATQVENGDELVDAIDPDHPEHALYERWEALQEAVDDRRYRLEAEEEARLYGDE